jgi:hypothetical protein
MLERLLFLIFPILGLVTSVGVAMVIVLMGIRTWKQLRSGDDEARDDEILDGIDRLELQLSALADRLTRLEQRSLPLPSAPEDDADDATDASDAGA